MVEYMNDGQPRGAGNMYVHTSSVIDYAWCFHGDWMLLSFFMFEGTLYLINIRIPGYLVY